MTTRPVSPQPNAGEIIKFPDAPPEEMTAYFTVNMPGYPPSLLTHFSNPESTVILSEIAAGLFAREDREGIRFPDLLIAFNARPEAIIPRNGYLIPEQGKPPDFVLEVASESTGRRDETIKREDYARMGVLEYWRFDPSGGTFHSTHLAGDRLAGEAYEPVPIYRADETHLWGRSEALGLSLCWEEGQLRFWDPVGQQYLHTFMDERNARLAERDARLAERDARLEERDARLAAEARARQLEEELRRLRGE